LTSARFKLLLKRIAASKNLLLTELYKEIIKLSDSV